MAATPSFAILPKELVSYVMGYLDPLSIYKWSIASRGDVQAKAIVNLQRIMDMIIFGDASSCSPITSVEETEESKIAYLGRFRKDHDTYHSNNQNDWEVNASVKKWASIWNEKAAELDLKPKSVHLFDLMLGEISRIVNISEIYRDEKDTAPIFLEHIKASLKHHTFGCTHSSSVHDKQWEMRLVSGATLSLTYLEWFALGYSTKGSYAGYTDEEENFVLCDPASPSYWTIHQRYWEPTRGRVLIQVKEQCKIPEHEDWAFAMQIRDQYEGIPMDVGDVVFCDDDSLIIEYSEKENYEPTESEIASIRNETQAELDRLCDLFHDEIITWEDAGIGGTRRRLNRAEYQHVLEAQNIGKSRFMTRSALDYLQQVTEELFFGKSWKVCLADGSIYHVVLGHRGSCFCIREGSCFFIPHDQDVDIDGSDSSDESGIDFDDSYWLNDESDDESVKVGIEESRLT